MKSLFQKHGMSGLLTAQAQVAFNDNAIKLVLIGLVQMLLPQDGAARVVSALALLLVAPFVVFAPLSGWLADSFPNRKVMSACLWFQLAVMGFLLVGTSLHSLAIALGAFFLLGLQSALMGPARRGLAKEVAGEQVGEAVGWMEMTCVAAILVGSVAGGQLIDGFAAHVTPWVSATISAAILVGGCLLALWIFRKVPSRAAANPASFRWSLLWSHGRLFKLLRRDRGIWQAALGDAVFYLAGGVLMLSLAQVGRELHPDGHGAARATGIMLAVLGLGIAVGSIAAARANRHSVNVGLAPVGALGLAIMLGVLAFTPAGLAFHLVLGALGVFGGLFLVPLGAYLVDRSPDADRGSILAASSMLSSIAGVLAVGLYSLTSGWLGLTPSSQFLVIGGGFLLVSFLCLHLARRDFLRLMTLLISRAHYRVIANGADRIPARGGVLLVCNHVSYVDTLILSIACKRSIRFMAYDAFFQTPLLGSILRLFGAVPISATKAKEAIRTASEHLTAGEVVCIFPEGQLTRTGCLMELKSGFELIARRAKAPVVVAHLDGLWGSIYTFAGGKYFFKRPESLRRRTVRVAFSQPLAAEEATTERVREILLEQGAESFLLRDQGALGQSLAKSLRRNFWQDVVIDPVGEKTMERGTLLVVAQALALTWKRSISADRVGILLPPGVGGALANLGVIFAGKVPVNLNPTLSSAALSSCIEQAGLTTTITAHPVQQRFPKLPWTCDVRYVEDCLRGLKWTDFARGVIRAIAGRADRTAKEEAILLFTSGTSGLPKGVALTHRNVLGNMAQAVDTGFLQPGDRILSGLPLFHSFGLTMGLLFPILAHRSVVTAPSPLDADKLAQAAREGLPTVLLSTPTFLRGYIKRIPRDAFGTLRLVVTGAEKLPKETAAAFRERFGCEVMEGYGLTETSPVACLNMPAPARGIGADSIQIGNRFGSVGRLLPGLAARFLDPETELPIPGATEGVLALKGINVADGYLSGCEGGKFRDGWFITGDVARVDPEGFLFISGRLSRFSKIGGEMVSHLAIEEVLAAIIPARATGPALCVLGRPHAEKGEEIVLISTSPVERETVSATIRAAGLPNLWTPREVIVVPAIPLLGSGKLDLASCRELVKTGSLA